MWKKARPVSVKFLGSSPMTNLAMAPSPTVMPTSPISLVYPSKEKRWSTAHYDQTAMKMEVLRNEFYYNEEFDKIYCNDPYLDADFERFNVKWTSNDGNSSGSCCFYLSASETGKIDCCVMLILHDIVSCTTIYRTFTYPGYMDSFMMNHAQAYAKEVRECIREIYLTNRATQEAMEVIGKSNFSLRTDPLRLSAFGFSLAHEREGYVLTIPACEDDAWMPMKVCVTPTKNACEALKNFLTYSRCAVSCAQGEEAMEDDEMSMDEERRGMEGLKIEESDRKNRAPAGGEVSHQWGNLEKTGSHARVTYNCSMNDGTELFYTHIQAHPALPEEIRMIDRAGNVRKDECKAEVAKWWVSPKTWKRYPVKVVIKSKRIELVITNNYDDQEVESSLHLSAFYEGGATCTCTFADGPAEVIKGTAFVKCTLPPEELNSFKGCFANLKEWIAPRIFDMIRTTNDEGYKRANSLPNHPLLGNDGFYSYNDNYVQPMNYAMKSGSMWRSGFLVVATRMLTTSSQAIETAVKLTPYIEIGQTSSLMVDDIQDMSEMRRGVPCAYKKFGANRTLMAALVATTDWITILDSCDLPVDVKYKLTYVQTIASRHLYLGQLEDVSHSADSVQYAREVQDLINLGESKSAETRMMRQHALKTGVPVGLGLLIAGVLADFNQQQLDALYAVGLEFGVAYQLANDLMDYDLKSEKKGDDIREHKITYPLLTAMKYMEKSEREKVIKKLTKKNITEEEVEWVIEKVKERGGIKKTKERIVAITEETWKKMSDRMPSSLAMLQFLLFLRSFIYDMNQYGQ